MGINRECLNGVRLGIDMGGTLTKFLVLENGEKKYEDSLPTPNVSCEEITRFLIEKYRKISNHFKIERVGIGVPGVVTNGLVDTDNLPIHHAPLCEMLKKGIDKPITIDNDANCAALAEATFVDGKCDNLVMVTIGTGIGGGIILDGQIRRGRGGLGELCHMSIEATRGKRCSCGYRGCWESYASTTALVSCAERAARRHTDSYLYKLYHQDNQLNGILIFRALRENCPVAKAVFSGYLDKLAVGIKNIIYIFDPDVVVLAGGITKDGDLFLDDLKEKVRTDVPIRISVLQNEAGAYGAAILQ